MKWVVVVVALEAIVVALEVALVAAIPAVVVIALAASWSAADASTRPMDLDFLDLLELKAVLGVLGVHLVKNAERGCPFTNNAGCSQCHPLRERASAQAPQ